MNRRRRRLGNAIEALEQRRMLSGTLPLPSGIALNWLESHAGAFGLGAADVRGAIVTDRYADAASGQTYVYLRQTLHGLPVAYADMTVALRRDGHIVSADGNFVAGLADVRDAHGSTEREGLDHRDAARYAAERYQSTVRAIPSASPMRGS